MPPVTLDGMTQSPRETRSDAQEILRTLVGRDDADFHDGQFEAISALVDDGEAAAQQLAAVGGCNAALDRAEGAAIRRRRTHSSRDG